MKDQIANVVSEALKLLPAIALAALGGVANTLAGKPRGEAYNLRIALPEIGIAIFAGIVTHYLCDHWQVPAPLASATIALAGYSARGVLAVLHSLFLNKLKNFK